MAYQMVYPRSNAECVRLLLALGFRKKRGIGNAKHPEKYMHPKRRCICTNEKPFILVTHRYFDERGKKLMKKLECWEFTKKEIIDAYNKI